ncbi:MAG: LysR family transcriptional regulator [Polaromonas sp.]|nr:LysR family transcriptional regulator [Polaromonas sp.]
MATTLPIKALLAFDAAMKHSSFSLAAQDLCVTPGAVGQQIQKLEEWLGATLFIRSIRQVTPTPDALNYWAAVQPALSRIQQASNSLRLRHTNEVWLSMPPSLAAKWFALHMADFLSRYPDISLHLSTSVALADFDRETVDLAIRHFDGNDPALSVALLYQDEARLYCAPGYAQRLKLKTPDDLEHATLIHTTLHPHWGPWMARFSQLATKQVQSIPSLYFDQSMMGIEAARQGQGVVLSSALLTEGEIRGGTLCEPFACRLELSKAYYLVHHQTAMLRPATAALKNWLLSLRVEGGPPATACQ